MLVRAIVGGVSQTYILLVAWVHNILARIKKMAEVLKSRNFSVGEAYDFMNFRYDTMTFYLSF